MAIKCGLLPSTNDNHIYSSRDLIRSFEYLFYNESGLPAEGIIRGWGNEFKVTINENSDSITVGSGLAIHKNPLSFDDENDDPTKIEYVWILSDEDITFDLTQKASSSQIDFDYTNKNFFELFNEYRHVKTGNNNTLLIMEIRFQVDGFEYDSEGIPRSCIGPTISLDRICVVDTSTKVLSYYTLVHNVPYDGVYEFQIGWLIGNLAYGVAQNSDVSNLDIMTNALTFYDQRTFAKSVLQKHQELDFYESIKKEILLPVLTKLSILTTNNLYTTAANKSEQQMIDFLSDFIEDEFYKKGLAFINKSSLIVDEIYNNFTYESGYEPYSEKERPTVYVNGNVVRITGALRRVSNATTSVVGDVKHFMCTLPSEVPKASQVIYIRNHCSGTGEYLLSLEFPTGKMFISRIVRNGEYDVMKKNEWIRLDCTYIVDGR